MTSFRKGFIVELAAVLSFAVVSFGQGKAPVIQDGTPVVVAQVPTPRTAGGKPIFAGVWGVPSTDESKILADRFGPIKDELPDLTPWAKERFEYNHDSRPVPGFAGGALPTADPKTFLASEGSGTIGGRPELNPIYKCVPPGTPYLITGWGSISPQEILQDDRRVLMIYEYDHTVRQIWIDGRKNPDSPDPTWVGHSVGTWDGDTLVVDTVGLRTGQGVAWLDNRGYVASSGLHIIERYKRLDKDTLQIDFTYDDPKAFTKPWTRREFRRLRPKWDLVDDTRCYPGSPELQTQEGTFNELFTEP
jgi:hypothetical protein